MKPYKESIYKTACNFNQGITDLYNRLEMPTHNYYALINKGMCKSVELRNDKDYLVLLVSMMSPIGHLLGTWTSMIDEQLCSKEWKRMYIKYCKLEPDWSFITIECIKNLEKFLYSRNDLSYSLPGVFIGHAKTLKGLQDLSLHYRKWLQKYPTKSSRVRKDISKLWNQQRARDEEVILDDEESWCKQEQICKLLEIFLEYINNLAADPKNRLKYSKVQERVSVYVCAVKSELEIIRGNKDGASASDDNNADDIIGSVFERLWFNATQYKPLLEIGPAYIYWIFVNRILKIGDPQVNNPNRINLLFKNQYDIFAYNKIYHSEAATIADQAKIHLFNSLCQFWEKTVAEDTGLSKFLFDRAMPVYADFMTTDLPHKDTNTSKKSITHQHCRYPISGFSSDFLVRIFYSVPKSLKFSVKRIFPPLKITDQEFCKYLTAGKGIVPDLCINEYLDTKRDFLDNSRRSPLKINYKHVSKACYSIANQEEYIVKFEKLYLLNENGIGCRNRSKEWVKEVAQFWDQIYADVKTELEKKGQQISIKGCDTNCAQDNDEAVAFWKDIAETLDQELHSYTIDLAFMIFMKTKYVSYIERAMVFMKESLFYVYTQEQYGCLNTFLNRLSEGTSSST